MLNNNHFVGDKFYRIDTIVGLIDENSIEEYDFLGFTYDKNDPTKQLIIYETYCYYGESVSYDIIENDRLVFETKADAEQYIGYYNNGKNFIDVRSN